MDMIIRMYPIGGLRLTLVACVENRSKKGQKAHSPRQRPGYSERATYLKKGQKHCSVLGFCPYFVGVGCATAFTQGVALGYGLAGLSCSDSLRKRPRSSASRYRVFSLGRICRSASQRVTLGSSKNPTALNISICNAQPHVAG